MHTVIRRRSRLAPLIAALVALAAIVAAPAAHGATDQPAGTIEVRKALSPTTDPGLFDLSIAGVEFSAAVADVGDGGTTGARSVAPGTFTVAETAGTGTSLADYTSTLTCLADGEPIADLDGIAATTAAVDVADGQTVVCTFANTREAVLPPTPTVLPPSAIRGLAGLRGAEGCVLPGVIRTRITGMNMRMASFYRDGRLVKRVRGGTTRMRTIVLRTRVRSTDFSLHSVFVRVRFVPGSRPRSKTLMHRFAQCRIAGVTG